MVFMECLAEDTLCGIGAIAKIKCAIGLADY